MPCISRMKDTSVYLTAADRAKALKLFSDNHIPLTDRMITRVRTEENGPGSPPGTVFLTVTAQVSYKGLPIFNSGIAYYFENGVYTGKNGFALDVAAIDTTPHQSLKQVYDLFSAKLSKDTVAINKGISNACITARYGLYYIANADNTVYTLRKAWFVTPSGLLTPQGFIWDDDGLFMSYYSKIF